MISVDAAKEQVLQHVDSNKTELISIVKAMGYVLAHDIIAPIDLPNFDNSAMDGYGLKWQPVYEGQTTFDIIKEVKAGDSDELVLTAGKACPIYTGAPVPQGVELIVPIEETTSTKSQLTINEGNYKKHQHVRKKGEQIKCGDIALKKGVELNPSAIGFLAAMGISMVEVYSKPRVAIITTGNELKRLGTVLEHGQIYESNAYTLKALLLEMNIEKLSHFHVLDDYQLTYDCFENAFDSYDIVISTGGVSMGKYDYVPQVVKEIGVKSIFYKVNQKPGKPIFFGKKDNKLFFGLPGNPAAVVTSFYQYVLPAINKWQHKPKLFLRKDYCELNHDYIAKGSRTKFLKAKCENNKVEVLEGQGSHILASLANANCLIEVAEDEKELKAGKQVLIHKLSYA